MPRPSQRISIVDSGMGNLRSVEKALRHVAPDADISITADADAVRAADRVVFPGQGAMPDCMRALSERGLGEAVRQSARTRPFLGLCVGQQMLFEHSDEGDTPGLGIFSGQVRRFTGEGGLKVPHMGWNEVWQAAPHALWRGIGDGSRFYFVHSYYCDPVQASLTAASTDYPGRFTSAIARDNIFATQFHPEKSSAAGLTLLGNFVQWDP